MFKAYSNKGCMFECKLENTYKSVGCIPWDYPIPPSLGKEEDIPMCTSTFSQTSANSSLARFNHFMNNEAVKTCNCLPDCEQETRFEAQVDSSPMDIDDLCTVESSIERVMKHWELTQSPLVYWTKRMVKMANKG